MTQDAESQLEMAARHLADGDFSKAHDIFQVVLETQPDHARAWHLQGVTYAQQGELESAAKCFANSVQHANDVANYHYNLGLAYRGLDRLDEAVTAYRAAIDRDPDFLEARNNLGNTLIQIGKDKEAIDCFRSLVERFPDCSIGHFNLANLLADVRETDESIAHYRRAIEIDPDMGSARESLGQSFFDMGQFDDAVAVWNAWLDHEPGQPIARHLIASVSGADTPLRCADEYVRNLFHEDFAAAFDQQLKDLGYQVPELIGDAIDKLDPQPVDADVLDAGCGTGLCGRFLRPVARRLVGVDLSPDMLRQADIREHYDQLVEDELTRYIDSQAGAFDLIVSGDTLIYFGDLRDVFDASHACLRGDGSLIFTVESSEECQSYELQKNGRYRHNEQYVTQSLIDAGFTVLSMAIHTLRTEHGRPVAGLLVTARRLA